jgi:ubiquitin-like domain-containing CTD phosphatase 1
LGDDVWDGETWAPYASLIILEVHNVGYDDDRAFRLIYNGQVLTDKVEGCLEGYELCDVMYLFNRLRKIAVKERDCSSEFMLKNDGTKQLEQVLFTREGAALLFILTLVSGTMGGLFTFVYLTRRLPCRHNDGKGKFDQAPSTVQVDDDDEDIEVTPPYGYGAPDTSSRRRKELVLEENIIL